MKRTHDYDNVMKTLKTKHKRLFISVINEAFGRHYPLDAKIESLPTEGYLTEEETGTGEKKIEEQVSDFLIRLGNEVFLLEIQAYDDDSMAIRIAEYAFLAARQSATWEAGRATIPMPHFAVIYVKCTKHTPLHTEITFTFPDGQEVSYQAENILLDRFTKEEIVEKRLFPYIPFYIARYEKEISQEGDIAQAVSDLEYFRDELLRLHREGELSDMELVDLRGFVNTIITHITDGNQVEERLVNVMGGIVLETESEKLIKLGEARGKNEGISIGQEKGIQSLVELCQELNLTFADAVQKLTGKFSLSEEDSQAKAKLYWKN